MTDKVSSPLANDTPRAMHTPGPWAMWDGWDHNRECWSVTAPSVGFPIAGAFYIGGTERAKANARLIAAAPDLLDVLDRFAKFPFSHQGPAEGPLAVILKQAEAVIAKATGNSQ